MNKTRKNLKSNILEWLIIHMDFKLSLWCFTVIFDKILLEGFVRKDNVYSNFLQRQE